MIIDFHTHVFSPRIRENRSRYITRDPCFALLYAQKEAKLTTADELIASMDEAGVDVSVILNLGWCSHELCVETNDYILESIARYPKRLVGFCAVQPQLTEATIAEIGRCAQAGARGIGELRPDMQSFNLNNARVTAPFIEVLKKHKLILLLHTSEPVGHSYMGKGSVTPDRVYPFITSYRDLTIVCAHWGGGLPFYALMPEVKKALQNVYFDTAASPFLYKPEIYQHLVQIIDADRILFGSDYPLLSPTRLLGEIESLDLSKSDKDLILSGNAQRLLGIEDSSWFH